MSEWRRSSFCADSSCVEVKVVSPNEILLRNSRDPNVALRFTGAEWRVFLAGADAGEFDPTDPVTPTG